MLTFTCPICGSTNEFDPAHLDVFEREYPSCATCGSSTRQRSLIYALSCELNSQLRRPIDAKSGKFTSITGIGISDWEPLSARLSETFDYTNTYFHQEPLLDITNLSTNQVEIADFVVCSDVLEHIPPPVEIGFASLFQLLKPGGLLVFSVPYDVEGTTIEHFPNLFAYTISEFEGNYVLHNETDAGEVEIYTDLIFHGGPGTTLEMRWMSLPDVTQHLLKAGFQDIKLVPEDSNYGLIWLHNRGRTLTARKPATR